MPSVSDFFSLYRHGFVRVAVGTPRVEVASPAATSRRTLELMKRAAARHATIVLFPELGLSAYATATISSSRTRCSTPSKSPLRTDRGEPHAPLARRRRRAARDRSAAVQLRARLSAGGSSGSCRRPTCRTTASSTRSASSRRRHLGARRRRAIAGRRAPFGAESGVRLQRCSRPGAARRDLRGPVGADSAEHLAALAGATVLANLSASNVVIGKPATAAARRQPSASCIAAYLYAPRATASRPPTSPGTAMRWSARTATLLAESGASRTTRSSSSPTSTSNGCRRNACGRTASAICVGHIAEGHPSRRSISRCGPPRRTAALERPVERFPYVPSDPRRATSGASEVYRIQVQGLARACGRPA